MKLLKFGSVATLIFSLLLYTGLEASQPQSSKAEEQLQLLFYSPDTPAQFLVVEKKHQRLKLFEQKDGLKLIKEWPCATGENPGNKKTSGDSRTPEGIYHITEIYEDKRVSVFGSRAFHLDYPNSFDTLAGRLGDGIFIHGTNKKLNPNSTNGCIALNNSDLDELAPYLAVYTLPIIVLSTESEFVIADSLLLEKNSSRFNETLAQLTFDPKKIPIDNLKTLSYLKLGQQLVISASYKIVEDKETQYNERKRAYLAQSPNGNWRTLHAVQNQDLAPTILALLPTKNGHSIKISELAVATTDLVSATNPPEQNPTPSVGIPVPPPAKNNSLTAKAPETALKAAKPARSKPTQSVSDKDNELRSFVEKWRSAWANKDIETYMNCYSPSFKSGNLRRDEWRAKKTVLNQKYKFITVNISNLVIETHGSGAKATFQQTYRSDQLQTSGTKTLHLINRKGRWMIENEVI